MTPADELRAAAEKIRKLADALPANDWGDLPWQAEECANTDDAPPSPCPCIVSQGEHREFTEPQIPLIQYVADAETPEFAAYIAAMHPGVGKALALLLESVAELHEPKACEKHEGCAPLGCDWCGDDDWPCSDTRNALAVARAILGGPR